MVVAHNLLAMNANRMFGINNRAKAKSTEKLSSGYKINRAADDAAGLAMSEKMRRMVRELNQGADNTQDGISFVQIGDGAMEEINDIVNRITELSVKAANGTCTEEDRTYIDEEVQSLKKEINRIAQTTVFNEIPIFDNHSVSFGLEGTPKDLEIFDATYDAAGNLATYGGFLFHGERITWDMIDPDMITKDPGTGKQVFKGGEYSYTSQKTGYSFAFDCRSGDVPPIITREISIEADSNGIILGKERFDWSKVYDVNGNTCSENNLHAGPWAVNYYGAKFTFTLPDSVTSLEDLAKDVSSCKSATVSYNWEVYYKDGLLEQAVDVNRSSVDVIDATGNKRVTQEAANTMSTTDKKGLEMTVRADTTGIWLQQQNGNILAGSKKTWQDLGITSWDKGMEVPGWNNGNPVTYSYSDTATGLQFQFSLSDITSLDSVVDGLDGMKITGTPGNVKYDLSASVNAGYNVNSVQILSQNIELTFEDELTFQRDFNAKNWDISSDPIYHLQSGGSNGDGGIWTEFGSLGHSINFNGDIRQPEAIVRLNVKNYLEWVAREVIAGKKNYDIDEGIYMANVSNSPTPIHIKMTKPSSTATFDLSVSYDYKKVFHDLRDNVKMQSQGNDLDPRYNLYIWNRDEGKYVSSTEYLNKKLEQISDTDPDKDSKTALAKAEVKSMEKFKLIYIREAYPTTEGTIDAVASSVLFSIFEDIGRGITLKLTSQDYSRVDMDGDELTNNARRPQYKAVMKETPLKPDIYIVHSGQGGDATGISRFAMNTTAMGIAFADCRTVETAEATLAGTKRAQQYVAGKRATYGAIQNRLEHTYQNNQNVSENTAAAESRIRDTDMATEMVRFSNLDIIQQAGQAMLAQANQSNQGVLSLLQ